MKKRILIFNGWYIPSRRCGGPVTSIRNTVDSCYNEFDFYIVAANHDFGLTEIFENISKGWNIVGNAKVCYVPDKYFDFNKGHLIKLFEDVNPNLVWFSGILHPEIKVLTMKLSKKLGFPVLFSPRGEVSRDRVTKLKAYKKLPYLFLVRKLGIYKDAWFHATSTDEFDGLVKYVGANKNRINYVANIPVLPSKETIRRDKSINNLKVVFISRIHEVKNLKLAIMACNKIDKDNNIIFDIYGPIESKNYWDECQKIIHNTPKHISIQYKGVLVTTEVSDIFKEYHCFLFPTFNENYGHVIAESLANGCPVILSKGTTPWDDINQKAGYICNIEDVNQFAEAINKISAMDAHEYQNLVDSTIEYYTKKIFCDDAIEGHKKMFHRIINTYDR